MTVTIVLLAFVLLCSAGVVVYEVIRKKTNKTLSPEEAEIYNWSIK